MSEIWRETLSTGGEQLDIRIHPARASRILIICPGHGTSVDGQADKYVKIADDLVSRGGLAVVRMSDPRGVAADLDAVVAMVERRAEEICGNASPMLELAGHSAGASAAATVGRTRGARRLLLIGMPSAVDLTGFTGEVYVTIGSRDKFGLEPSRRTYDSAASASRRELAIVPRVEHGFHGIHSRLVYRRAFPWAFAGEIGYPGRGRPGPTAAPSERALG